MVKFLLIGAALGAVMAIVGSGLRVDQLEHRTLDEWRAVPVTPPPGPPALSQKSIDLALTIYGINVPATAAYPVFNRNLDDRGLSSTFAWDDKIHVEIGPSAFASWGMLGSTLAHELEVHCLQSFTLISIMDILNLDGTARAERQAYLHELRNAQRFGLSATSKELIASTMDYYYQLDENSRGPLASSVGKVVGRWLARKLVTPPHRSP